MIIYLWMKYQITPSSKVALSLLPSSSLLPFPSLPPLPFSPSFLILSFYSSLRLSNNPFLFSSPLVLLTSLSPSHPNYTGMTGQTGRQVFLWNNATKTRHAFPNLQTFQVSHVVAHITTLSASQYVYINTYNTYSLYIIL